MLPNQRFWQKGAGLLTNDLHAPSATVPCPPWPLPGHSMACLALQRLGLGRMQSLTVQPPASALHREGPPPSKPALHPPSLPRSPGCSHTHPSHCPSFRRRALQLGGHAPGLLGVGGMLGSLCSVPPGPFAHESLSVDFLSPFFPSAPPPALLESL